MNIETDMLPDARERHRAIDFLGLRAHATTVGLLQLCDELLKAGVLNAESLQRIKDAIRVELTVSQARRSDRAQFDAVVRDRLDAVFPAVSDTTPCSTVVAMRELEHTSEPRSYPAH